MLINTDVLIWYLKGNKNAQNIIIHNIPFKINRYDRSFPEQPKFIYNQSNQ
jgi:hypothetical protein